MAIGNDYKDLKRLEQSLLSGQSWGQAVMIEWQNNIMIRSAYGVTYKCTSFWVRSTVRSKDLERMKSFLQ
ncbi:unnamed protein product [Caretta caretta]